MPVCWVWPCSKCGMHARTHDEGIPIKILYLLLFGNRHPVDSTLIKQYSNIVDNEAMLYNGLYSGQKKAIIYTSLSLHFVPHGFCCDYVCAEQRGMWRYVSYGGPPARGKCISVPLVWKIKAATLIDRCVFLAALSLSVVLLGDMGTAVCLGGCGSTYLTQTTVSLQSS